MLSSIWNYCLHLAEMKKRWILIKFWTGMIYGKIYDYFPMPNYSWTNGIFLWFFTCRNYFCTWQNFSKFTKNPKNVPPKHTHYLIKYLPKNCMKMKEFGPRRHKRRPFSLLIKLDPYRSCMVNSNTVNSKFHLIRSFCEMFSYHFMFKIHG